MSLLCVNLGDGRTVLYSAHLSALRRQAMWSRPYTAGGCAAGVPRGQPLQGVLAVEEPTAKIMQGTKRVLAVVAVASSMAAVSPSRGT